MNDTALYLYLKKLYVKDVRPVLVLLGVVVLASLGVSVASARAGNAVAAVGVSICVGSLAVVALIQLVKGSIALGKRLWANPEVRPAIEGIGLGLAITVALPFVPPLWLGWLLVSRVRRAWADPVEHDLIVACGRLACEVPIVIVLLYLVVVAGLMATLAVPFMALAGYEPGELYAKIGSILDVLEKKEANS